MKISCVDQSQFILTETHDAISTRGYTTKFP